MGTNPVAQMMQSAAEPDPNLDKVAQNVMKELGLLYRECHRIDPSGQGCQAVQQIMQAVSEVVNNVEGMANSAPPAETMGQAAENVMGAMQPGAEAPPMPVQPGMM